MHLISQSVGNHLAFKHTTLILILTQQLQYTNSISKFNIRFQQFNFKTLLYRIYWLSLRMMVNSVGGESVKHLVCSVAVTVFTDP